VTWTVTINTGAADITVAAASEVAPACGRRWSTVIEATGLKRDGNGLTNALYSVSE